jgi:hypothetical protein|tara:strand:+ start:514 stop:735 length:222 start_codon:yes stop_codon:yes gene_type:complete
MAKKTTKKESKKAEPKKEVKEEVKEEVKDSAYWAKLYAVHESKTSHPDHKGKDIYVKNGCHGYFDDAGIFVKV